MNVFLQNTNVSPNQMFLRTMNASTRIQIKSLIKLVHEYNSRKSEKNLAQVQRQLQILSIISDLSVFEPTCMEIVEFFKCLNHLLGDSDHKSTLPWKVINLLIHISSLNSVRVALRDELGFIPLISQLLLIPNLSKDKVIKLLSLLQDITYGVKISRTETWLIKLIPKLASILLNSQDNDEVVVASVVSLANLCRGNAPAVQSLSEFDGRKQLVRSLIDLKTPSYKVTLVVLEILIYINLDHTKLDVEWFVTKLDHIFMVARFAVAENDCWLLELSKDVFREFLQRTELQEAIRSFSKFGLVVHELLEMVKASSCRVCLGTLFQLLSLVFELEHESLSEHLEKSFLRIIPWLQDPKVGFGTPLLLHSLVMFADHSVTSKHMDQLIQSIKESLKLNSDFEPSSHNLDWLSSLLLFVQSMSERDTVFNYRLSKVLEPPFLSRLMDSFVNTRRRVPDASEFLLSDVSSSSSSSLTTQNGRCISVENIVDRKKSLSEKFAEVVSRIVVVSKCFAGQNEEFKVDCKEMLSRSGVIEEIVCCQRSSDAALVNLATEILCEDAVSKENIGALVKAQTEANSSRNCSQSSYGAEVASVPAAQEQILNGLIDKLSANVDRSDMRDVPLTSVMELYEYKVSALERRELVLENALQSTDQTNRETRLNLLQAKSESSRLRTLLRSWEQRLQSSQTQKDELGDQISSLQEKARQQREELLKNKSAVERQLVSLENELSNSQATILSKDEENKRLQKNVADAKAECKALQKQIKQEQKQSTDLREVISKMEEEKIRNRKSYEDLEKDNLRLEKINSVLKNEKMQLDMFNKSQEQTIAEKEAELEHMRSEIQDLKKIREMIHNISAKKTF